MPVYNNRPSDVSKTTCFKIPTLETVKLNCTVERTAYIYSLRTERSLASKIQSGSRDGPWKFHRGPIRNFKTALSLSCWNCLRRVRVSFVREGCNFYAKERSFSPLFCNRKLKKLEKNGISFSFHDPRVCVYITFCATRRHVRSSSSSVYTKRNRHNR